MPCFVGLDSSKKTTSICVMDRDGTILQQGMVESTPKAIAAFLRGERRRYVRVGLEAWSLATWLYEGLTKAGLPVVLIETRRAHAVLKGNRNKTDRNDARGIADIVRTGAYRKVHVKSHESQEIQAMLTTRRMLSDKAGDIDNHIRGMLLGVGLKLAAQRRRTFEPRVRTLAAKHPFAADLIYSLLAVRSTLLREKTVIEAKLRSIARDDPICRRLMTAPGIGELTALEFRSSIDEPHRFKRSRALGAHLGMTPKTFQSGDTTIRGRITGWGDANVRRALVIAAWQLFKKNGRKSWLREWAAQLAERKGTGKAMVAAARKLAVILHRMWVSETDFQWESVAIVR